MDPLAVIFPLLMLATAIAFHFHNRARILSYELGRIHFILTETPSCPGLASLDALTSLLCHIQTCPPVVLAHQHPEYFACAWDGIRMRRMEIVSELVKNAYDATASLPSPD